MNIYKGDVYWIKLNENIDEKNIPHPHIVIQDTIINQSRIDTIVVCGITTNMRKINWPGNILLEIGEANLQKISIVDVSQIYVVNKNQLGDFIGKISDKRLEQIFSGMKLIQSL